MTQAGGLQACVDLLVCLVCCNLLARAAAPPPTQVVYVQAPDEMSSAVGGPVAAGELPALLCAASPASTAIERN